MTVVGLLDVVKVSISAEFESFLVIMCFDDRESTTNFHSSGLRVDGAGRIRLCRFCTLIHIVRETAIVSFRTLPVGLPLPTIS